MSIKGKGRERHGLVLAAGALLSSLGVVMVALVCCGVPVLTGATGALAIAGNSWFIAAASLAAGLLLLQAQRQASPATDCYARSRPGTSLSAVGPTPTNHSFPEQERSGQSQTGASTLKDAGSRG